MNISAATSSFQDNESLWSLLAFDKLTHIGGNVVISNNNPKFPETNKNVDGEDCIGFCLLKDYVTSGVISPAAKVYIKSGDKEISLDDLTSCNPTDYNSYVLDGHEAVVKFIGAAGSSKETVKDLVVRGSDVTEGDVRSLDDRVERVTGTLTLENLGTEEDNSWISTDQVMENISIEGSVVLKDIQANINPNGFENLTKINGDLKVINCPRLRCSGGWMPFKNLTEVTGDVLISGKRNSEVIFSINWRKSEDH